MDASKIKASTIDEYIAQVPDPVQAIMQELRKIVKEVAPEAVETISYAIPTFKLNGSVVYFAAYARHIGVYPCPAGDDDFQQALASYRRGKGTAQFPLDQPFPFELFRKLVAFRLAETQANKGRPARKPG